MKKIKQSKDCKKIIESLRKKLKIIWNKTNKDCNK